MISLLVSLHALFALAERPLLAQDGGSGTATPGGSEPAPTPAPPPEPPKAEAKKDAKPAKKKSTSPWGLRAGLGFAWTQASETFFASPQPGSFSGAGARVGLGGEYRVDERWGAFGEAGYHNLFGPASDTNGKLGESDTYTLEGNRLHLGYLWLGGRAAFNKIRVEGGPTWSMGAGTATGIGTECAEGATQTDECMDITDDSAALRYQRQTGSISALGLAAGASYGFTEVGPFTLGANLVLGFETDRSRNYPWAELGLSLTPS